MRRTGIYIGDAGKKGRGVFTKKPIANNTVIEIAPVIILGAADRKQVEKTKLFYYIFEWGEDTSQGAIALGFVSIYNHHSPSNCEYEMDYKSETIAIRTMRDIGAGEELTINYSAGWDNWNPVWFKEDKPENSK